MKKVQILTVALVALAVMVTASAAMAVDFVVNPTNIGSGNWTYSITNNTSVAAGEYVVDWYLYWDNPLDGAANAASAAANFDNATGYVNYPSTTVPPWDKWEPDNTYGGPGFVIRGAINTGVAPMTTSGLFTVHFKGPAPNKAYGVWQTVTGQIDDFEYSWTNPTVPEPSSMLALILGCVGSIGFIRFRKR